MKDRLQQLEQFEEAERINTHAGAYPLLAARVFDTPLLIERDKLNAILHVLGPRMGFDVAQDADPDATVRAAERMELGRYETMLAEIAAGQRIERRDEGYYVAGDVAIVPVMGTLLHRSTWMDAMSGMTSYAKVERMFAAAQSDYSVRTIIAEYDSHGGEVAGAFDSADRLFGMRGGKPIYAVVSEVAASGGYLLASTADRIFIPRTGLVGSIGVVMTHMDMSKALEKRGVAVTYLYAGERKIDGSPLLPLSEPARTDMQEKINAMFELFVSSIERNTGLSAEKIIATQAAMFMGQRGVDVGLAHEVGSFQEVLAMAIRQAGPFRLNAQHRGTTMSASDKGNGGPVVLTAEDVAAARAEGHAAGMDAGTKAGGAAAVTAERSRIKAIVTHAEAAGRADLAAHLAFDTDMPAEAATAVLAKSPKAAVESPLQAAMRAEGGGHVASQPGASTAPTVPVINAADIFARRRAAAQAK